MAPAENIPPTAPKKIAIVAPTQSDKNNDSDDEIQIIHEHINRSKPKNPRKKNNNEILTLRHGLGVPSQCYEIVKDICSFKGSEVDRQRTILYSRNQISHASSSSLADTIREVVPNVLESIVYKEEIKHTYKSKDNDNTTAPSFAATSGSNVAEEFIELHDNNIDFDNPPSPPTTATIEESTKLNGNKITVDVLPSTTTTIEESMNLDVNNIAVDVPPSTTVIKVTAENVNVNGGNVDFVKPHQTQEVENVPMQPDQNNDKVQIINDYINRSKPQNPRKNNDILTLRHELGRPSQCFEIIKDSCSLKGCEVDKQRTILYSRDLISNASSSSLPGTIREVVPKVHFSVAKEEVKHTSKSKDNDNATPPSFAATSSSNVTEEFMDLHDNNIDFDDPPSPPTTATVEESMNLDDNNIAIDVPPSSAVSAVTEENVNVIGNNDDFVNNHPIQEEFSNANNMEHDSSPLSAPSCGSSEAKDCNGADDQCNVDPKENFGLPVISAVMSCSSFYKPFSSLKNHESIFKFKPKDTRRMCFQLIKTFQK